jgi:hypothetical protein
MADKILMEVQGDLVELTRYRATILIDDGTTETWTHELEIPLMNDEVRALGPHITRRFKVTISLVE